ncbi:glycoside hydrolase family 127 protein [Bacteroides intestinalis]|uniref:glycoside hydrolase family 127 protein n=1 Tax=Bacteroides intestinalis TaxID=329854 RepID=UPI0022E1FED7|nr:glycoside hydrolase family 127 protein [Bacteroides intestinalis]
MKYITCLLVGTLLSAYATAEAADTKIVVNPVQPAQRTLFSLTDVRLGDSQFKDIQELDHAYLLSLEPERLLSWFRREAGLAPDAPAYPFWESEDVWGGGPLAGHIMGFSLSSMSMMYEATGDEALKRKIEKMVRGLKECQDAQGDGYLLATINGRRIFEEVVSGKFTTNNPTINGVWEPVYIMNKIMLGLYNAYLSCDLPQAKDVLVKMADWFGYQVLDKLTYEQIQELLVCEHGSINESYITVYEITGDKKYLKWAKLLNDEDMLIPAAEERDILNGWHANTQIPKFTGFEKVYNYTQEDKYTRAAQFFWETVVDKHTWVIGGNSTGEHFFPVDQFEKRVPSDGGPESCNSVNMMRLTETLYQDYGRMKMVDYYERVLYNHILANYDPHEGMCTYYTSMRPAHYRIYGTQHHSFWCCTGTGMEAPAKFGKMIYAHQGSELYVNLFMPSELNWKDKGVKLVQNTDFPDNNKVVFVINTAAGAHFTLNIRKPHWSTAKKMTVWVNGKKMQLAPNTEGYVQLDRSWSNGDKVEVELTPQVTVEYLKGSDKYAAFLYGPVVLAAKVDNNGLEEAYSFRFPKRTVATLEIPMLTAPALIGSLDKIKKAVSRKSDKELVFECSSEVASTTFELIPFNRIHFNRYAIYFPLYKQMKDYQAVYDQEKKTILENEMLQANTVDHVLIQSPLSESDHKLAGVNMDWGEAYGRSWRHASNGGYFMYQMAVLPDVLQSLYMQFINTDGGARVFDVLVDGKQIATIDRCQPKDIPDLFYYEVVPLPKELLSGKNSVTVKLHAKKNNTVGGLFDIRIVKVE